MNCSTRAKLHAAMNLAAGEEAKRRGYSQYRVDGNSLKIFEKTVHIRPIGIGKDRSQHPIHSVLYRNKTKDAYVVPETREMNLRRDAKRKVECSGDVDGKGEPLNLGKVHGNMAYSATEQNEAHVHARCAREHIPVPKHCAVHFNRVRRTETRQYELETEGNIRIVIHPGHPIAKHAAIGGAAGAAAGGALGVGAGGAIGATVGVIAGPPGILAGFVLGGAIGGLIGSGSGAVGVGGVGGAIGAARGVAERHQVQFTITAEDVFRNLSDFKKKGGNVVCQVTVTHEWDEEQREITEDT